MHTRDAPVTSKRLSVTPHQILSESHIPGIMAISVKAPHFIHSHRVEVKSVECIIKARSGLELFENGLRCGVDKESPC